MIDMDSQPSHANLGRHMGFCRNSGVWPKGFEWQSWGSSCKAIGLVGRRHGFAFGAVFCPLRLMHALDCRLSLLRQNPKP